MKLYKNVIIYGLTTLLGAIMPFLFLPIVTKLVNPYDYGIYAIIILLSQLITPLISIGVPAFFAREYYKNNLLRFKKNISLILFIPIAMLALSEVILFIMQDVHIILNIEKNMLYIIPLTTFSLVIPSILSTYYRINNEPYKYSFFEITQIIFQYSLLYYFLILETLTWEALIYAFLIRGLVSSCFGYWTLYKNGFFVNLNFYSKFSKIYIYKSIKFGISLMPHALASRGIRSFDRIILNILTTTSVTGIYMVSAQVTSILLILISAINLAWTPYLFSELKNKNNKISLVKNIYKILFLSLLTLILLNYFIDPIFELFIAKQYHGAKDFILFISIGYWFMVPYVLIIDILLYYNKIWLMSKISIVNFFLNLVLLFILIDLFGPIGAAYATAISYIIVFISMFVVVNITYKLPWLFFIKGNNSVK